MAADVQTKVGRALTDDERALFDQGFREYKDQALKIASAIGADADEAVQAAVFLMIDLVTRAEDPEPCPKDKEEFGIAFRGLVRRIARSKVRKRKVRKTRRQSVERTLVRPLSSEEVFASDWAEGHGWDGEKNRDMMESLDVDVVDGEPRDEPQPRPKYRLPQWPVDHDVLALDLMLIFWASRRQLPRMQNLAIKFHLWELSREEAAEKMGVSVKTYDEHLARGKKALRWILPKRWWMTYDARGRCDAVYRSDWNDVILGMFTRFIGRYWQEGVDRLARLQAGELVEDADGDDDGTDA